jgi:alkanesulfonate monooxygenase SsuD/methylene tetrahydromethanopterin reductase-like flavin-dependent oxidoreductase (luciferase family)
MLPTFDQFGWRGVPPVLDAARAAEEAGFDSLWCGDHLRGHIPVIEAHTALAATIGRTERVRVGFAVMLLAMRHLAWTAKQLGSLAALAPGRLALGVGVGGEYEWEWEAAGVPVRERGRRTDEALPVLLELLRGEAVDHPGPLLELQTRSLEPPAPQRLPLLIGGRSPAARARAVRYADAWMPVWLSPRRLAEAVRELDEACARAGREPLAITTMVFCAVVDDLARAERAADAYLRAQYRLPYERTAQWCVLGDADHVAERLAELRQAGSTGFVLVPLTDEPLAQVERLAALRPGAVPS